MNDTVYAMPGVMRLTAPNEARIPKPVLISKIRTTVISNLPSGTRRVVLVDDFVAPILDIQVSEGCVVSVDNVALYVDGSVVTLCDDGSAPSSIKLLPGLGKAADRGRRVFIEFYAAGSLVPLTRRPVEFESYDVS